MRFSVLQLRKELVYTSFIIITTLRFTCGERKICATIKKSENVMNMIVVHFEGINYLMPQPEEEFHLETLGGEDTDNSSSVYDAMSSADEDNEPTPES